MKLIGFCGVARSGKDTACQLLGGYRIAFTDALKTDLAHIIRERYGLDPDNLTPEQKETIRPLYVAHGAVGRAIRPDLWVAPVVAMIRARRVKPQLAPACYGVFSRYEEGCRECSAEGSCSGTTQETICVTDVRYANEVKAILDLGGYVVYINRPGVEPANDEELDSLNRILLAAQDGDYRGRFALVENSGTKEEFALKLRYALDALEAGR